MTKVKTIEKAILIFVFVGFVACKSEDKDDDKIQSFDRALMLEQYADGLIIPAYSQSATAAVELQVKLQNFVSNPEQLGLEEARVAWKKLASAWQHACGYNFGPAAEAGIKKSLNEEIATFPVSKSKIEQYITGADTSFNNFDRDSRGLFAIDFLLFESGVTDTEIIAKYNQQTWPQTLSFCLHQPSC